MGILMKFKPIPENERKKYSCKECTHFKFNMKIKLPGLSETLIIGTCRPNNEHVSMHRSDETPCLWFKLIKKKVV